MSHIKYFAYGANMCQARLQATAPSARVIGTYQLKSHDLRFHKRSRDKSGKCDAYETGNDSDLVMGRLFCIKRCEKHKLDKMEGLGKGYNEKKVAVADADGNSYSEKVFTYYATCIDKSLCPYTWYKKCVLIGAMEASLPTDYIKKIEAVKATEDLNLERARKGLALCEKTAVK